MLPSHAGLEDEEVVVALASSADPPFVRLDACEAGVIALRLAGLVDEDDASDAWTRREPNLALAEDSRVE